MRNLNDWLGAYMEYSKGSESPDMYHYFTALSTLASVVRRNVWIDQKIYLLFPNLYVVLVGIAGKLAKSTTIRLGRSLLFQMDEIEIGPDSLTREELIRAMSKSPALTIHSTELSSLIDPSGIKMIQFLTDIYDCDWNPKGWRYETKGAGKDVIHEPVLNILAGTTPSWIAKEMPIDVLEHGFTSRTLFIAEDSPRFLSPFPEEPDAALGDALVEDLRHISELRGPMKWSPEAREAYVTLYEDIYNNPPEDYRIESYHWRKKIHVLKLAMLISLATRDDLTITANDLQNASEKLLEVELKLPNTFSAIGQYAEMNDLQRIEAQFRRYGSVPYEVFYRKNMYIGPEGLQGILGMLTTMGVIKTEIRNGEKWITVLPGAFQGDEEDL